MTYTLPRPIYDSLLEAGSELATKEFVRAEISEVRVEISEVRAEQKNMQTLLKVIIGLMIFGLTLANPAFIELLKSIT